MTAPRLADPPTRGTHDTRPRAALNARPHGALAARPHGALDTFVRGIGAMAIALSLMSLAACDERSGSGGATVTPGGHGEDSELKPEGDFEGESIDELDLHIKRLSDDRDSLISAGNRDPGKCEELCELSRSICEVQTKMCEIADGRVADDDYQNLCRKAKQRCQNASSSCIRCVEHHEHSSGAAVPEPASCGGDPEPTETD